MNYQNRGASIFGGFTPTRGPGIPKTSIPAPMSTGISLSDRFKFINKNAQPKLMAGGFGYGTTGLGAKILLERDVTGFHVGTAGSEPQNNKMLAAAMSRQADTFMLRKELLEQARMGTPASLYFNKLGRGGVNIFQQQMRKPPIQARIGGMNPSQNNSMRIARVGSAGGIMKNKVLAGLRMRGRGKGGFRGNGMKRRMTSVGGGQFIPLNKGHVVARGGGGSGSKGGRSGGGSGNNGSGAGGGGQWYGKVRSKEALDSELDSYMSKSRNKQKVDLDKELEDYMEKARAAAGVPTEGTETETVSTTEDVNMTEETA